MHQSDTDVHPFSLMEAMGHEEETGGLVRQDADPDAGQPEPEHEDTENCDQCTNSLPNVRAVARIREMAKPIR